MKKLNVKIDEGAFRRHLELVREINKKERREKESVMSSRRVYHSPVNMTPEPRNIKSPFRFRSSWRSKSNVPNRRAVTAPIVEAPKILEPVSTGESGSLRAASSAAYTTRKRISMSISANNSPINVPEISTRISPIPLHQFTMDLRNAQDEKRELSSRYLNTLNDLRNQAVKPSAQVKQIKRHTKLLNNTC